ALNWHGQPYEQLQLTNSVALISQGVMADLPSALGFTFYATIQRCDAAATVIFVAAIQSRKEKALAPHGHRPRLRPARRNLRQHLIDELPGLGQHRLVALACRAQDELGDAGGNVLGDALDDRAGVA